MSLLLDTLNIEFTPEQTAGLAPAFQALRHSPGGTVIAQVWPDGMRVTVIDKATSDAFAAALGGYRSQHLASSLAQSIAETPLLN